MSVAHQKQVPVNTVLAGLYEWTMTSDKLTVSGHVVVRGDKAKPIGGWDYPPGTETWYWGPAKPFDGDPSFRLTLVLETAPDDPALIEAVSKVRDQEKLAGMSPVDPSWVAGAPLPNDPQVVTLVDVLDGPGQYDQLYYQVSFLMPIDGDPVMPTWYTTIPGLYSVFGGDPETGAPVKEGTTAKMAWAKPGEAGFPKPESWLWFGRDPR